jgi:arginyl-tRNA synthetase
MIPVVINLWKMMNGWVYEGFDVTYRRMGVSFDRIYYESETYHTGKKIVEEGLKKSVLKRKEGRIGLGRPDSSGAG